MGWERGARLECCQPALRDSIGLRQCCSFALSLHLFVIKSPSPPPPRPPLRSDYYQAKLALEWRQWMTQRLTADYFAERTFYQVQAGALLDNPDQRIAVDVR